MRDEACENFLFRFSQRLVSGRQNVHTFCLAYFSWMLTIIRQTVAFLDHFSFINIGFRIRDNYTFARSSIIHFEISCKCLMNFLYPRRQCVIYNFCWKHLIILWKTSTYIVSQWEIRRKYKISLKLRASMQLNWWNQRLTVWKMKSIFRNAALHVVFPLLLSSVYIL